MLSLHLELDIRAVEALVIPEVVEKAVAEVEDKVAIT